VKLQEGKRYLFKYNGVQQAGTYDGTFLTSNIAGFRFYPIGGDLEVIKELTGIYAAKVGDIVVDDNGNERKILEIGTSHTAFIVSYCSDHDGASDWITFKEADKAGWKLKGQEETVEISMDEIAEKFGVDVDKLKVKKEK